jgi:hypothetical protein
MGWGGRASVRRTRGRASHRIPMPAARRAGVWSGPLTLALPVGSAAGRRVRSALVRRARIQKPNACASVREWLLREFEKFDDPNHFIHLAARSARHRQVSATAALRAATIPCSAPKAVPLSVRNRSSAAGSPATRCDALPRPVLR